MKSWEKKAELIKVLGVNQKAGVKVGDEVEHPLHGIKTKVVVVYKDLLGNERVLTEHARRHIGRKADSPKREAWERKLRKYGLERVESILRDPDFILEDQHREAILYVSKADTEEGIKNVAVVIGKANQHYIYTIQPMDDISVGERYIVLYERKAKD